MKSVIFTLILISGMGCNTADPVENKLPTQDIPDKKDFQKSSEAGTYTNALDSLANAPKDTSTLDGKRQFIFNQYLIGNGLTEPLFDTLMDLNYDGRNDYIIGYYAQAGTGIKNSVEVYLYNPQKNYYQLNEQLSGLPNPTFYLKQKKITSLDIIQN